VFTFAGIRRKTPAIGGPYFQGLKHNPHLVRRLMVALRLSRPNFPKIELPDEPDQPSPVDLPNEDLGPVN
jgi:hypothetical protein